MWRYEILADLLKEHPHRVGAEIGVREGRTTRHLLENLPGIERYYCVDPWVPYARKLTKRSTRLILRAFKLFETTVAEPFRDRIVALRMTSEEAAPEVTEDLDFVFIDANHEYEYVRRDIELWAPKVKVGLVAGHDYGLSHWHDTPRGVADAVDEAFGDRVELGEDRTWWAWKGMDDD